MIGGGGNSLDYNRCGIETRAKPVPPHPSRRRQVSNKKTKKGSCNCTGQAAALALKRATSRVRPGGHAQQLCRATAEKPGAAVRSFDNTVECPDALIEGSYRQPSHKPQFGSLTRAVGPCILIRRCGALANWTKLSTDWALLAAPARIGGSNSLLLIDACRRSPSLSTNRDEVRHRDLPDQAG